MTVLVRTRPWMSSTHAWIRHAVSLSFSFVFVYLGSDSVVHATLPLFVHLPSLLACASLVSFYPPAHHAVVVVVRLLLRWFLRAFGCVVSTTHQVKGEIPGPKWRRTTPTRQGETRRRVENSSQDAGTKRQFTTHSSLLTFPIDCGGLGVGGGILCGRWRVGTMGSIPAEEEEDHDRNRTKPTSNVRRTPLGRTRHHADLRQNTCVPPTIEHEK